MVCGSLGLQAQTWEVHAFALRQTTPALGEGDFPETTYNLRGIAFVRDAPRKQGDAQLQYVYAFAPAPPEAAKYQFSQNPSAPYITRSGSYNPGGFVSAGINLQSPGELRVGVGLEFRLGVQDKYASSGDTAGGEGSFRIRPWANVHVRYAPKRLGFAPVLGFRVGFSTNSAPAPNRELSFFAGLRH